MNLCVAFQSKRHVWLLCIKPVMHDVVCMITKVDVVLGSKFNILDVKSKNKVIALQSNIVLGTLMQIP